MFLSAAFTQHLLRWLLLCSVFFGVPTVAQEQCNWNNNATFPLCTSAGTINPDGWGWENNASCISTALCSSNQNSGGIIIGSSASSTLTSSAMSSASSSTSPAVPGTGWRVSGSQVLDPNGQPFVMRGVNHAHTWFTSRLTQSLADIAAAGANTVRVVLSNGTHGQGWGRNDGTDVANIIAQCKRNKLVCVLEVHDATGYGESVGATHISKATEYWLSNDIRAAIDGQEHYVIVNIANEPFGNSTAANTYVADTKTAIQALRAGGIQHLLMVDGSTWGQDWQGAMRTNAAAILAADPNANVMFSVHMYEVYDTAQKVQTYMNSFVNSGLALVVGEFGAEHNGSNVAEEAILQYAEALNIGYLGWSWSGNGSCCTSLDIVNNWNASSFSPWGDYLFNSPNGIKATSRLATIYLPASSSSSSRASISSASSTATSVSSVNSSVSSRVSSSSSSATSLATSSSSSRFSSSSSLPSVSSSSSSAMISSSARSSLFSSSLFSSSSSSRASLSSAASLSSSSSALPSSASSSSVSLSSSVMASVASSTPAVVVTSSTGVSSYSSSSIPAVVVSSSSRTSSTSSQLSSSSSLEQASASSSLIGLSSSSSSSFAISSVASSAAAANDSGGNSGGGSTPWHYFGLMLLMLAVRKRLPPSAL